MDRDGRRGVWPLRPHRALRRWETSVSHIGPDTEGEDWSTGRGQLRVACYEALGGLRGCSTWRLESLKALSISLRDRIDIDKYAHVDHDHIDI